MFLDVSSWSLLSLLVVLSLLQVLLLPVGNAMKYNLVEKGLI